MTQRHSRSKNHEWVEQEGLRHLLEYLGIAKLNRQNEKIWSTMLSNFPCYAYRCHNNKDWAMEFISVGVFDVTGYQSHEFFPNGNVCYGDLIKLEDREYVWNEIQRAIQENRAFQLTYRITTASGKVKWVFEQGNCVEISSENGEILEGIVHDITEKKESEERFLQLNEIFLKLGPDIDQNIQILTDACGELLEAKYVCYNKVCENEVYLVSKWGVPENVSFPIWAKGTPCLEVMKREKMKDHFSIENLSASPFNQIFPIVSKDGLQAYLGHDVECFQKPIGSLCALSALEKKFRVDDQKILEILASAISIEEERKLAQWELIKAKDEAEKANMLKDKFVSLVSHDLRSPFNSIMGYLAILKEETCERLNEDHKEILQKVLNNCAYMLKMIDGILDLSRFKSGKIILKREFVDGGFIAKLVVENLKILAKEKGIILLNKIPYDTRLFVDMELYQEVIQNLLSNAIKFCKKGDCVTLFVPTEWKFTIAVRDTGNGINKNLLPYLFNQEEKTSTIGTLGEKGTGLGLPISYEIMEAHGGTLRVETEEGQGSTFYAELPPILPQVLIVDDLKEDRFLLSDLLQSVNVEIWEANNGKEALGMINDSLRLPHLIISDINMPILDGFGLLSELKRDHNLKSIPVIMLTSDTKKETRERMFRLGASDFLLKPLLDHELLPRVERIIMQQF